MAVLKLIEGMWAFQKRKESADKIAEAGRKLCDKLTVFLHTFVEIGSAIERAHGTFEKARGQLVDGRGNVVKLAKQMVDLGVRMGPGKTMPAELVALAGEDEEDEETPRLEGPGGEKEGDAG
jgi:DNA recombination protein RmuC